MDNFQVIEYLNRMGLQDNDMIWTMMEDATRTGQSFTEGNFVVIWNGKVFDVKIVKDQRFPSYL